jgi:predicted nucleic acid-binding protein
MSFVLDTSLTLAWILPDEGSEQIDSLFEQLLSEGAVVPGHWKLEVANTLLMAERRGRIDANFRIAAIADLEVLPIVLDEETATHAWRESLHLAARQRLTIYDAAYLELALREGAPLGTLDADLIRAARQEQVPILGEARAT